MSQIQVAAERAINAPAERVYRVFADYEHHHPNILPPQFHDLRIEQGGIGTGTVFSFKLTVGGRTRGGRMTVTEVEPGRVLAEHDTNSSLVTTFTVLPQGERSHVRIETVWDGAGGVGGLFERIFAPRVLRGVYQDELNRLDAYAQQAV
jgi:uncharacterized protein YndB with AHSA1/START domain